MIRYNHSGYDRQHEKEIVLSVEKGVTVKTIEYDNGVKRNDHRFSRDPATIQKEIYTRIDWKKLPKLSKKLRLFVHIKIGYDGYFSIAEVLGGLGDPYRTELEKVLKYFPPVQVFYSRGEPLQEAWTIPILFTREMKRSSR